MKTKLDPPPTTEKEMVFFLLNAISAYCNDNDIETPRRYLFPKPAKGEHRRLLLGYGAGRSFSLTIEKVKR